MIERTIHLSNPNHLPGIEVVVRPKGHPTVHILQDDGTNIEIADAAECRTLAELLDVAARTLTNHADKETP